MSSTKKNFRNPLLGTRRVCQIAVVVRDIEKTAKAYAEFFDLPVPPIITTEPGLQVNQTYRGQPTDARCKLAFFKLDNTEIELTQPLGGQSSWQEALDAQGGVHSPHRLSGHRHGGQGPGAGHQGNSAAAPGRGPENRPVFLL